VFALGVLLILALSIRVTAQTAQELYQRGLVQEHAKGDLKQAIALYEQAAQAAGKDRALAAKALIRKAGLQEKLGASAEAEKTYAELLRTYPEQRSEVSVAQKRLKALRRAPSPGFIDRAPVPVELASDTEIANRLARFLWSDVPDDLLLDAALRGDLHNPRGLNRQVLRMLRDPRSGILVDTFFAKWLSLDSPKKARSNGPGYLRLDPELLQAMETETRYFLRSQLQDDRDAVELWTAPYTYVNDRLARYYRLPAVVGKDFKRVPLPPESNRAGLLGQAGVLTALSLPSRTSPTKRGIFVMSRYLGYDPPAPPANIPPLPESRWSSRPTTMREQMTAHRSNPQCASCHSIFDPIGFALENFDAIGRWRTTDNGLPIDASGTFTDGTRFSGPVELRLGLLNYRDVYYTNITQLLLAHALNRKGKAGRVYDYESPVVQKIVRDASANGYRWSAIIAGITASAPFQAKEIVP
jgi:hypothetical protein